MVLNTDTLLASDKQLAGLNQQPWRAAPSQASIDKFVAAAEKQGNKVVVVDNKEAALNAIISSLPDGSSISTTGSISLEEVGFIAYAKENASKWNNLKAKFLAEQDPAKQAEIGKQIQSVQYLLTTPVAVTENAEVLTADFTITRVGPTLGAEKLLILVGGQKLVPDLATAHKRLQEYVLPLESARVREVYKLPGSSANFVAELKGPNPFGAPGRITFIFVKQELGY